MSPIPKFAQVLAKRAKAKPKVISGSPKFKKFAKDDMELAKVRKEKIKKDVEKIIPKHPKDGANLLLAMDKLRNTDISQFEGSEFFQSVKKLEDMDMKNLSVNKINNFIENLKIAFKLSKKELNTTDSVVMLINEVMGILEEINSDVKDSYSDKAKNLSTILTRLKAID